MKAFVFPGQGSQQRGMGTGLFDRTEFRTIEGDADRLLGYSVRKICTENPDNILKQTEYTQPCLYIVNALHFFKARDEGHRADYLAGHSLGEYNALLAAGAFDFMTGLRLVSRRGTLMAQAKDGAMAAILGLSDDAVVSILQQNQLGEVDIANHNAPTQIVIAGCENDLARAKPIFEKAGAQLFLRLPVSAAFHSRKMTAPAKLFSEFLQTFKFDRLQIPVISNVTGRPYPENDPTETMRMLLEKQVVRPVQWTRTIQFLIADGVKTFFECGPGTVLTRLIAQIRGS